MVQVTGPVALSERRNAQVDVVVGTRVCAGLIARRRSRTSTTGSKGPLDGYWNVAGQVSVFNAGPVSMFQQPYAGNYVSPSIYAATSRKASAGSLDSAATAPAWSSW